MGVVRDITIDQLTQAVQGISSNGISDSTGQAINNTLSTLGKDITLQAVVNALQNLQVNINQTASNVSYNNSTSGLIATNVQGAIDEVFNDLKIKFVWEEKEFNITYTSTTNPVSTANVDISKSGYTPIGVISWGVFGTSSTLCFVTSLQVNPDNSTLYYAIRVRDNGTYNHFLRVRVLYLKN